MKDNLLTAQEIVTLIGTTVPTLNMWYKWKELNPEHELAKLLPKYIRIGNRNTRYWRRKDVLKLIKFKENIPIGRAGIMGEVTQLYVKKGKKNAQHKTAHKE